ncbi:hypothetical protein ACFWPH_25885 [Nocardia sp. NPDC058499]|uniref:hypothetical protein n=1 Tax=Nocardia sp. NPDC058499 TaxID=3346530 RepID=UPI0036530733
MSGGRTPGWTEQQTGIALCAVLAAACGLLAGIESGTFGLTALGITALCALAGLVFDGFIGLVVGLVCATAAVALKRYTGIWNPGEFLPAVALAACLLALGWAAGLAGAQARRAARAGDTGNGISAPVYGSLGLLTGEYARLRLDEEIARAREHRRPLGLLIIRVNLDDPGLSPAARQSAGRAVARLVESLLRESDVPFSLSEQEFGAILPDTGATTGWNVVGPLLDAAGRATFTDRSTQQRRPLSECAELQTNLVFHTERTPDADTLIALARESTQTAPAENRDPAETTRLRVIL